VPNGRPRRIMRVPFDRGNDPVPSWPSTLLVLVSPAASLSVKRRDVVGTVPLRRYLYARLRDTPCSLALSLSLSLGPSTHLLPALLLAVPGATRLVAERSL